MSTDSPSTTDRLAWIKRRLHLATPRDVGPREADFDAECRRLQTARLDLSVWAPLDIEYLLELVGVLEGQLATAREALAENVAEYDREIASLTPPTTMSREDEEFRDLARAEAAEARRCLDLFDRALGLDGGDPDER